MEKQTVPTPPPPQQPAISQKPKSSFLLIGLAALVLILLVSTGFLAFQNYQLRKEVSQLQSSPSPSPTPDPTANWKTYTSKDGKFLIKYPDDWLLEDKSKEVDLYGDGNVLLSQDISISKNGHIFRSYNPLAWGPSVCLFPDSIRFEGPYQEFEDFTEIKTSEYIYRRPKTTEPTPINDLRWAVCRKESNSGNFSTVAGFGYIWYETPINYDRELLTVMDQILSTFKLTQ